MTKEEEKRIAEVVFQVNNQLSGTLIGHQLFVMALLYGTLASVKQFGIPASAFKHTIEKEARERANELDAVMKDLKGVSVGLDPEGSRKTIIEFARKSVDGFLEAMSRLH